MTPERQANFQRAYRSRVTQWYNGYAHVGFVLAMGAGALYIYIAHIRDVKPLEWLIVPVTFVLFNFFEWYLHKFVMHQPPGATALRPVYLRHTADHHQFFSDEDMAFRDHMDWRVTVFPPYAMTLLILTSMPFAFVIGAVLSANSGWLFMCVTMAMYLLYETIHFCCHLEENAFVRHCPLINSARRHHTAHHNHRLMLDINMNVSLPIADWALGTSDLDRGLLGHLFNGYDTTHLKKNLRTVPNLPGGGRSLSGLPTEPPGSSLPSDDVVREVPVPH